jgi:hypothetical protein
MQALFQPLTKAVSIAFAFSLIHGIALFGEEPVKKFLDRLREERMYEIGLKYLEISVAQNRLPESMKEDLPLERILLLQDSLMASKTVQQRDERIAAIEKDYKAFLTQFPNHLRRSEAQTKLGDLLLSRAQTAIAESKKDENKETAENLRVQARESYTEALDLYNRIIEELKPILEAMKGDKIKPDDTKGKERRDRYQAEYRQAQILSAKMMEYVGQTYAPDSAESRQWLEKSEAALSQIIDKTSASTEAGRRMLSLLYRADVQSQLGKVEEARDSYTRVAENEGQGIFKTWRVQAIAGIIRLDSSEKTAKYEAAIARGDEALKGVGGNEKSEPEWIDLQLAIAEARLAYAPKIDAKDDNKIRNNRREARELLQAIVKRQSSRDLGVLESVRKAKILLGDLGVEVAEKVDVKLPESRNFADSIKAGRERLNRAEDADSTLPVVEKQLQSASEADKLALTQQLEEIKADSMRDRQQAIELYRRGLKQYNEKDSRDDLLEARFLLSYLLLRTDQIWESIAVAQDLLVSANGTDKAEKAGGFALMGLNKLIVDAAQEQQIVLMRPLESLAKRLRQTSPESEEATNAVDLLVKLALIHKMYDKAEQYVALADGQGGGGASMLGQILWGDYRKAAAKHRAEKTTETAEDFSLKDRAEKLLTATFKDLDPTKADKILVSGVNALASIYLASDRVDEALSVLEAKDKGVISLIESVPNLESNTKLEGYRIMLQAMVQASGMGKRTLVADDVSNLVGKMKTLTAGDDTLLTNSLRNLAIELQSKLEATKDINEQVKLAEAFGLLIEQLVSVSSDISTLDSAGTSIFVVATTMLKTPSLAANGKNLMAIAEAAFSKIATKPESDLIDAKRKPEEFQLKLGLAKSGSGKFEEANAIFVQTLKKSASNLTIQVEAARNLQAWAAGQDKELLKKALLGSEPNDKKVNQVWGWGTISTVTSKRLNDFKEIFFEARLNVAVCRKLMASSESGDAKKKTLDRALSDIRQTMQTYPELGGPESLAKFEKLTLEIQQELGKPAIGLNEFRPKVDPAPSN